MSPLVIIIMVLAFMAIAGASVALALGSGRGDVEKRLDQFVSTAPAVVEVEEETTRSSGPDVADRLDKVISGRNFVEPIRERISKADVKLRVSEYLALVLISSIVTGALVYLLIESSWVVAAIGAVFPGSFIPRFALGYMAGKRMTTFDNQLSDTLNLWVNALRSGYSVLQGMETIATELPPPVSSEFERVVQEVRLGLSLEQAMNNMYRRVPSEDLDLVITAVNIQREVGGNLAEVLDTISYTIRERVRIKGEIKTLTAQGRISGWIISLLPVVLGLLLYAINPEYVSELWIKEDPWIWRPHIPCGWLVIGFSLSMIAMGAFAIMKIVDIEV